MLGVTLLLSSALSGCVVVDRIFDTKPAPVIMMAPIPDHPAVSKPQGVSKPQAAPAAKADVSDPAIRDLVNKMIDNTKQCADAIDNQKPCEKPDDK